MKKSLLTIMVVILTLAALASSSLATNYYTLYPPSDNPRISFAFLKPSVPNYPGFTFLSGTFLIDGQFQLSDQLGLNLTLPLSIASYNDEYTDDDNEFGPGNLTARLLKTVRSDSRSVSWLSFELFLGTGDADDGQLELSAFGDYSRFSMYYPETSSLGFQYARHMKMGENGSAYQQYEVGLRALMSSDFNDETELILNYAYAYGITSEAYSFGLELLGQYFLTADNGSFSERTFNQIVFGMARTKSSFQPKLFYQIPLDDNHNDLIGSVFGLGFDIMIEGNGQPKR